MSTARDLDSTTSPADSPLPAATGAPAMPAPNAAGMVPTLNAMGFACTQLDEISRRFIADAAAASGWGLEIGAAYGTTVLAALDAGARMVANDACAEHLAILATRVPAAQRARLRLLPGSVPDAITRPAEPIAALIFSRMLHFLDGPRIARCAELAWSWLEPDGRVYVVSESPYIGNAVAFRPTYERRRQAGDAWPGWIEDVREVGRFPAASMPRSIHLLDPDVLTRVFTHAGFDVEEARLFARSDFPAGVQVDGREGVGLVARRRSARSAP